MGMWIGRPGALREITDGASSFDRSPDLNVSEFRSLAGGVTTWAPPVRPRRLKVQWNAMQTGDVRHLDRLARRLDQLGPVAVVDPLAGNLLGGGQAAGLGDLTRWAVTSASGSSDIILYGGGYGEYIPNTVSVEAVPASNGPDLLWQHPTWKGYPVTAGMVVTWWAPGLIAAGAALAQLRIEWYSAAGALLSTGTTNAPGVPMVRTVPANAAYARPAARFSAKGLWNLGESVFALGDVSAALVAGDRPIGEGCPGFSITRYSHTASEGDGAFRDIGFELVEVSGP
ncbi:hypothetical protein [Streptomyces sp. NPDC088256]|uniref:hypothetical protein n=1 Tax=Streptomyces sp. NPDC088256 TaxID=3365848 RepID=UPI0038234017